MTTHNETTSKDRDHPEKGLSDNIGPRLHFLPRGMHTTHLPTLENRRRQLCYNFATRLLHSETFRDWLPPYRSEIRKSFRTGPMILQDGADDGHDESSSLAPFKRQKGKRKAGVAFETGSARHVLGIDAGLYGSLSGR
ncbi:hypothetical protein Bbelb_026380 [Branchiostoma belcheri]|nr:hypothetical protein Bbelb_026380 [Branchiostoma belcheri]